jgi:putative effector of murein hydrolase
MMPETLSALAGAVAWFAAFPGDASLLWTGVTLAAYFSTMTLYRRSAGHPFLLPVLTGTAVVVALLLATGTSYENYFIAVAPLVFMIGPATVALAVPLFGQLSRLRSIWLPVTAALCVGSAVAIGSAVLIAWAFGGDAQTLMSLAAKSSTMPIATSLSGHFGGLVPLAAAAVALTGIAGTMLSGPVLRRVLGPLDDAAQGFALGLTAHAIGTARALQISGTAGAFAALAMSLNGVMTALWLSLAFFVFHS